MTISLRAKLIVSFMAVIVVCGLISTLTGVHIITTDVIREAQAKVKADLNSAREIYAQEIKEIENVVNFTALRFFIKDAVAGNNITKLEEELLKIKKDNGLDVLTLTDRNGMVIVRVGNLSCCGDNQSSNVIVNAVLSNKTAVAGTEIISKEELVKEGEDFVKQAGIKLIPTLKAKATSKTEECSGMMMKAGAPVLDNNNELLGVLYGGRLLNKDYKVVDKIKNIVYKDVKYKGKDIGTATIFQEDLRISTNVRTEDNKRAIGTRVSKEVYDAVLVNGTNWIDRAFVVNNWYITAYEPIRGIKGDIIGMLYVGILEEKFTDIKKKALLIFSGITLTGMLIALVISGFLSGGILEPVKRLVFASHEWAKGNLEYKVVLKRKDEMGELADTFNRMAFSLKEKNEQLKEYTEQQIMRSEKLATLGQLAAGVAHEINNPLGAILMYTHLALEDLPVESILRENLGKAAQEASRCRDIVQGLLDFARQTNPDFDTNNINEILERTLSLVENQSLFQNIKITRKITFSLPDIVMDANQIQQVFTNIIFNAAEAMSGDGELTVISGISQDNSHVKIEFSDTGCGISKENMDKLFDPFFSTKEVGQGTGLGLAVSYGIIARHKGSIQVQSELGQGAVFIIKLPLKQKEN